MREPNINKIQQDQLIELPAQVPQNQWRKLFLSPKFLILLALSTYFIGNNLYVHFTRSPQQIKPNVQIPPATYANQKQMDQRLYGYIFLSVFLFIGFLILRRANQKAELKQLIQKKQKLQQQQLLVGQKNKRIKQKAQKIFLQNQVPCQQSKTLKKQQNKQIKQEKQQHQGLKKKILKESEQLAPESEQLAPEYQKKTN